MIIDLTYDKFPSCLSTYIVSNTINVQTTPFPTRTRASRLLNHRGYLSFNIGSQIKQPTWSSDKWSQMAQTIRYNSNLASLPRPNFTPTTLRAMLACKYPKFTHTKMSSYYTVKPTAKFSPLYGWSYRDTADPTWIRGSHDGQDSVSRVIKPSYRNIRLLTITPFRPSTVSNTSMSTTAVRCHRPMV